MSVLGRNVEVLGLEDATMYLGRSLSFQEFHEVELKHRLKKAWAKFYALKEELCSKSYRLCHRLRLFGSVITPTVMYSAGTWTMTARREQLLKKTQRQMLRMMTKIGRKAECAGRSTSDTSSDGEADNQSEQDVDVLEPFFVWIQRATHISEDLARKQGVRDWVDAQRARRNGN